MACYYGHLEVAQWLLEIKPDIDISARDDIAFCFACHYGHLKVATWLQDLRPWLYKIIIKQNDDLIPHINTLEDQQFYKRKYVVWLSSSNTPNKNCIFYKLPQDVSRKIAMML